METETALASEKPKAKGKAKTTTAKKTTTKKAAKKTTAAKPRTRKASTTKKTTAAKKKVVEQANEQTTSISHDERMRMIAEAAYYLAEKRGFSGGNPEQDWIIAESQIEQQIQKAS